MNNVLEDNLKVVEPYVPHQLISPEAFSHIKTIARTLPPILSAGFECRLGIDEPKADFAMCVTASDKSRNTLADLNSAIDHPVWSRIHNFCHHWADQTSPLYENVENIWLEFDVNGPSPKTPVPSLFFSIKDISLGNSSGLLSETTAKYESIIETALSLLLNCPLSSEVKRNLLICFNALPAGAIIFQVGVLLARNSNSVRLCVGRIPKNQVLQYLINIGWTGSIKDMKDILSTLADFVDEINLNFTVDNTVLPKIGIECEFINQPKTNSKWSLFLHYLVKNRLCTPDKRDGFLNWPGASRENPNKELWSTDLVRTSTFLGSRATCILLRQLNHIKVVYQPNTSLEVKGYMWFGYRWVGID